MISASKGYSESAQQTPDAASTKLTADYLQASNRIFKNGILSKKMLKGMNSPVIENIKDGLKVFVDWFEKHKENGNYCHFIIIRRCPCGLQHIVYNYYYWDIFVKTIIPAFLVDKCRARPLKQIFWPSKKITTQLHYKIWVIFKTI